MPPDHSGDDRAGSSAAIRIFVDADGCPVKSEVYRVAGRHGIEVLVVANSPLFVPEAAGIRRVLVEGRFDAADDWIAAQAGDTDIVVTADIPLSARCLAGGATVLSPAGRRLTEENIGDALATRQLLSELRAQGETTGGPAPFQPRDRSRFLHALDEAIQTLRRRSARKPPAGGT
jgi:hypothetical protein